MEKMEALTPCKIGTLEQWLTICQDWLHPREERLFQIW